MSVFDPHRDPHGKMSGRKQWNKQAATSSFLDKKPLESLILQGMEGSTTLGKDEVGSSNLPISTTSFLLPVFSFCLLHSTSRACCLVDVVISPIYPCLRGTIDV